ncbi:MAG: MATE family efflux transporter [Nanoarchaeota archaeon]|nr:MATE family efflux transporter [Nanoarchaeota archaeon]
MRAKIDLSKGSIVKNLLSLAWPMMLAFVLQTGFNIVDAIFVGRLSAMALAAVSLTFPVVFLMISLASGIGVGTTSLIARLFGAKKYEETNIVAEHAYIIAIVFSLLFSFSGLLFAKPLFRFVGATDELMPLVLGYSNIIFLGSIFMFTGFISNSILRGEGDMKTPMKMMIIATIVNIILDPIMIFGFWFFPAMGISGAALATVIARIIGCMIALKHIFSGKSSFRIKLRKFKFKFQIIKDIFSVGIPTSLSQSAMSLGLFFMTKIVSLFGPFAIAAYGLGFRLDAVAVMPAIGLATAVITIVGFNVGAKKLERAKKTAWIGAVLAFIFMEAVGFIFFIMPAPLIRLFNSNANVILYGTSYLRIVALSYGFIGISIVVGAAFQGAGKGYPAFVLAVLRLFVISIPLAYFLAVRSGFGVNGIWWAISISTVAAAIVAAIWFKIGTWKKGNHLEEVPEAVSV